MAGIINSALNGAPPTTLPQFYALNHNQRKAYMTANPGGLQQITDAKNKIEKDSGLTAGRPTSTPFADGAVGAIDDSGQFTGTPNAAGAGLNTRYVPPTTTGARPAGGIVYGGTGPSTVGGNAQPTGPQLAPPTVAPSATAPPNGTNPPGTGMWSGNTTPAVGVPGEPGYQAPHPIAPNIVDTTRFANPNPTYTPQSNPLSPLSTPTPPPVDNVDPVTGQVKQTGADAGTVQGQLSNILKDGNPLLEAARARAVAAANARGLQNSSMASQAGEEAIVNSALPIAQQDANTFQNQELVNQQITNQFLGMEKGAKLNLQAAYEAFKQNNYGFDKNAALQTYLSDSSISNQQKIAALQAAVSQANTAANIQGDLEKAGMTLSTQQFMQQNGFTQQNAMAVLQLGAANLAQYSTGLNNIMMAQLEPEAKAAAIANWNAIWTGQNLGGLVIGSPFPATSTPASPTGSTSPTAPVSSDGGAGAGSTQQP